MLGYPRTPSYDRISYDIIEYAGCPAAPGAQRPQAEQCATQVQLIERQPDRDPRRDWTRFRIHGISYDIIEYPRISWDSIRYSRISSDIKGYHRIS